ncbi:hypothetical protein DVH05_011924 [Phytophthora capsici]|nr:hypothetical protein DVH05_011924 [Phytophthora capsici]
MARRATERQSVGASSTSDGGVDDDRLSRDSWLSRSTICANEEDDDVGDDADTCSWSQLRTPPPFSVLAQRRDVDETDTWNELKDCAAEKVADLPSQTCKGKRKLHLLAGFSNIEALQAQLPRNTSKQARAERGVHSDCKRVGGPPGHVFLALKEEIEFNRTKWDLERHLQDTESACGGMPERTMDRRGNFKPVSPTSTEEEANRRKWDLERESQDGDSASISYRTRELRRKLQRLNPFATKMRPAVASEAEFETHRRKWDLERNLEDTHRLRTLMKTASESEEARVGQKLPTLNQFTMAMNPVIPSAAEVEANRRKWDLERRLQDDATGSVNDMSNGGLRRKLGGLYPIPIDPIGPSADDVEKDRRKWDLERRLQDEDQLDVSVSPGLPPCKLPRLNLVASSVSRRKWDTESKTCSSNGHFELKLEVANREGLDQKLQSEELSGPSVTDRELQHRFEINESLVYLILFSSTAVLHCALFNFNLELRQFLRLDIYPLGVLLLLSWAFVGLIHFVGGVVGDLVADRVALVRRTAFLWGFAVLAIHLVGFKLPPVVSSLTLGLGLSCAGVAHGIICPNLIALSVESTLGAFDAVTTPLSPQDDDSSCSSGEEESGAESEVSYSSDVSTTSTVEQHEYDGASHNFFAGCFAARLAGSSIVQGYYFLMVNVDMFASEEVQTTADSRGFNCMLLMSMFLMVSLIYFCFEFWDYYPSDEDSLSWKYDDDQQFQLKLAALEPGLDISTGTVWIWTWTDLVRLCNRALVSYALLSFTLMTLIGAGFSFVVVLLATQTSLSIRLVAFLLIVLGWLLTMVAISRQMNPTKKQLLRECRRLGLRSRHFYLVMFVVAFICVSGCVAFLRAQLYTTMVVQVCQTHLLVPGTANTLFDPELLGTAVGTSSLIFLGFSRLLNGTPQESNLRSPGLSSAKTSVLVLSTSTLSTPQKTLRQALSLELLPSMASYPPATRMCLAMLLYLISVFMSSVVELYRRKAGLSPSVLPRSCGSVHSEFTFLWTSPYVVLLGVSDALFRVSLQEACHDLARGSFSSPTTSHLSRRWAGTVQGAISLAEALGYTTALSLVSVLSRWLFQPKPTDMALLFLLLTTMVALTHAVLNRIATRAQTYQRLHFRSNSTT